MRLLIYLSLYLVCIMGFSPTVIIKTSNFKSGNVLDELEKIADNIERGWNDVLDELYGNKKVLVPIPIPIPVEKDKYPKIVKH